MAEYNCMECGKPSHTPKCHDCMTSIATAIPNLLRLECEQCDAWFFTREPSDKYCSRECEDNAVDGANYADARSY